MVKVTKGAEGKCGGGSKMIKSEECLCEKGQLVKVSGVWRLKLSSVRSTLLVTAASSFGFTFFFAFFMKCDWTFDSVLLMSISTSFYWFFFLICHMIKLMHFCCLLSLLVASAATSASKTTPSSKPKTKNNPSTGHQMLHWNKSSYII